MSLSRRRFLQQGSFALSLAGLSTVHPGGAAARPIATPSDLAAMDATALAELVRAREVSPRELVEDVLRRVDRVNPRLNAVLTSLFDAEKALDRAAGELGEGPLAGVPVMLKNLTSYSEARIDSGSRLMARARDREAFPPRVTSPLVAAMERSGMIVTGITNSPEMGLIDTTEPLLHGPTRNPWNVEFTAGGSSGGSGAAVAAGIVPLAHGNDGGGSIRLPASHCGVFGLKPSRGRELGGYNGTLMISNDLCLSRTVRDTAAFLSVCEKGASTAGALTPVGFVSSPSKRRLRIAVLTESFHAEPPHPEVAQAMNRTRELCEQLGHTVAEVTLPIDGVEFRDAFLGLWASGTLAMDQLAEALLDDGESVEDLLEPWTLGLVSLARKLGRQACFERAEQVFAAASAKMEVLFERHDVVLSPVLRVPPFPLGYHDPAGEFEVILERVFDAVAYTPLQNAVGMPGVSMPLHWTADGLPVGSQFSAWRGEERTLLELAYELEEARPWADRRPPIFA